MLQKQFLVSRKAAAFLRERYGCGTPSSLAKWRVTGEGPSFRRLGRLILYDPDDLDSWAQARLTAPLRSTSEIYKAPIPQEMEPLAQPQVTGPSPAARRPRGRPRKTVEDPSAEPTA